MVELFELTMVERAALRAFTESPIVNASADKEPALMSLADRGLIKMEFMHRLPSKRLEPVYLLTKEGAVMLARISSPGIHTLGINALSVSEGPI